MKKILFVKNIIPPYRISLFNDLHRLAKDHPLNFQVFVMSESEKDRFWKLDKNKINFNFYSDGTKGLYKFLFKKYHFHFNTNLFKLLKINKFDLIILGGSWNDFNVLGIVLLKRLGFLKSEIAFWSEANYLTNGALHDNIVKFSIRKFILNTCSSFFLIPGKMASQTIFEKWGVKKVKTIFFPNLIDSIFFNLNELGFQERRLNRVPVFLIVARLNESLKGILNLISNIPIDRNFIIKIAGDGDDRKLYEKYIAINNLNNKIILLGNLDENELLNEYRKANAFILPSFSDSSPLSIVEASYMKLPLLISDRCGNHFETVENNFNGYLFNPMDTNDIHTKFVELLNTGLSGMEIMGLNSYKKITSNYNNQIILKNFINNVI